MNDDYGCMPDKDSIGGDYQANPECFTTDWSAVSETHWQNLLNSEVFKNYNINPITLIDNNPEYFSHLLGKVTINYYYFFSVNFCL